MQMVSKGKTYSFHPLLLSLFVLFCGIPAVLPLLHSGFPITDDGNWMIIRLSAFYEALRSGQFPVRFLPRLFHGYGYPAADFMYPLFLYSGSFLHVLGLSFVTTIKVILAGSFLLSGLFSFYWLRVRVDTFAAWVGAMLYLYLPYHVWDMYHRGSVGEMVALAVVPFVLWQMEKRWVIGSIGGLGLLLLSHNSLALLFFPLLLLYGAVVLQERIRTMIGYGLASLGVSSFFWLPALYDKQYVIFDKTVVSQFFSYFHLGPQLLGWVSIGICVGGIVLLMFKRTREVLFWVTIFFLSAFFVLPISQVIWHGIAFTSLLQFPFRLLSVHMLASAFVGAYVVYSFPKIRWIIAGILFFALVSVWFSPLGTIVYEDHPEAFYTTNEDSTTTRDEYTPLWVHLLPKEKPALLTASLEQEHMRVRSQRGTHLSFQTNFTKAQTVTIAFHYFPGWEIAVNGKSQDVHIHPENGTLQVVVPSGPTLVEVSFRETSFRLLADMISLGSIMGLGMYWYAKRKTA